MVKVFGLLLTLFIANARGLPLAEECLFSMYITPTEGTYQIQNPGHPDNYGPSANCFWYFYTDWDKRLTLDCSTVNMQSDDLWDCIDNLSVVGSEYDDSFYFCTPFNIQSSSNKLTLNFTSKSISKGGRFMCAIRAVNKEQCDCGWYPKRKIVGGEEAEVNEFTMMVSIVDVRNKLHACGGSIISQNFVLTAAHCLDVLEVSLTGLLVGEHDMSKRDDTNATHLHRAAAFFTHPEYDSKLKLNDIGLIKSATPIVFNTLVAPVCLPFNRPHLPAIDEYVTAIGWGTTSFGGPMSDSLLKIRIQVVPETRCQAFFGKMVVGGKQVCTLTPGSDTCQRDSGGPVIINESRTARYFLAALVSFGPSFCGGSDPSVNTRIITYLDWILKQTGENFCVK